MKLTNGTYYGTNTSDLMIKIIKVQYESDKYIKCKLQVYNRKHGYLYETKRYKLCKNNIKHWYELKRI
jgi:hypothetical protein